MAWCSGHNVGFATGDCGFNLQALNEYDPEPVTQAHHG